MAREAAYRGADVMLRTAGYTSPVRTASKQGRGTAEDMFPLVLPPMPRSFVRALLTLFALLTLSACNKKESDASAAPAASGATEPVSKTKPFVVGFIYVGPKDDYGYNQAHAQGAAAVAKMPGVKVQIRRREARFTPDCA